MPSAAVIVPTTGAPQVRTAVSSLLGQTHPDVRIHVVVDGAEHEAPFRMATDGLDLSRVAVCVLPENVGRGGFNGHRIYAAFSHLVNADYVLFLDEDNWFDRDHVAAMTDTIESRSLDWCYALRKIRDRSGRYLLNDDCESLGRWRAWTDVNFVDTNAYCLRQSVAARVAGVWHGRRGQDRIVYSALSTCFPRYACTGRYTVNYRLGGNPGSVRREFFEKGNRVMQSLHPDGFPWRSQHRFERHADAGQPDSGLAARHGAPQRDRMGADDGTRSRRPHDAPRPARYGGA